MVQETTQVAGATTHLDNAFILSVVKYAVWCIGIFFSAASIVGVATAVTGHFRDFVGLLKNSNALRMITVVGVIIVTTILALSDKMKQDAVVAIITALGAGALGGLQLGSPAPSDHTPQKTPPTS